MPLTPKEIEQKTFSASFRGYAEDEVDVFLEEVIVSISEYQQMIRERDGLLANGTAKVPAATVVDNVAGANEEANRILQAARRQADQLLADARAEAAEIEAAAGSAAAGALFTPEQAAERDRLIVGYQRLKDELAAVRARVQKALNASEEAFSIMEGQVGSVLDAAQPEETPSPATAAAAQPPVGVHRAKTEAASPVQEAPAGEPKVMTPAPAPSPPPEIDSDRPRRPWEQ